MASLKETDRYYPEHDGSKQCFYCTDTNEKAGSISYFGMCKRHRQLKHDNPSALMKQYFEENNIKNPYPYENSKANSRAD